MVRPKGKFLPFKMEYLNGNKMFVDALSRPPDAVSLARRNTTLELPEQVFAIADLTATLTLNQLLTAQRNDPELQKNISHLNLRQASSKLYVTKTGNIYLPYSLRARVLEKAHDEAGHLSAAYTLDRCKQFDWPNKHTYVLDYCTSCAICARVNVAKPKTKLSLQHLEPKAKWFNDRIHLDIVDMPKAISGHVAIITITDAATGFVILHPSKDKTANSVVEALYNKLFPFFGVPAVLVTDRGKVNDNEEVRFLCTQFGIQHIFSSVNHPQANGMVERRQQMIQQFFRKATETLSDQQQWPYKLPTLQLILNSSKSASRQFSPFFLTFFRTANFPFQDLIGWKRNYSENSTVAERLNLAHTTILQAYKSFEQSFQKSKYQFDKLEYQRSFLPGCIVYVATTQRGKIHHKFAKRYKGPYICLSSSADSPILILRPLRGGNVIHAHKNNCKLGSLREQLFDFNDSKSAGPAGEKEVRSRSSDPASTPCCIATRPALKARRFSKLQLEQLNHRHNQLEQPNSNNSSNNSSRIKLPGQPSQKNSPKVLRAHLRLLLLFPEPDQPDPEQEDLLSRTPYLFPQP
ncbi:MAG: DDE-type integrase/transposase/recombinase [Bacteroidota bacterium]